MIRSAPPRSAHGAGERPISPAVEPIRNAAWEQDETGWFPWHAASLTLPIPARDSSMKKPAQVGPGRAFPDLNPEGWRSRTREHCIAAADTEKHAAALSRAGRDGMGSEYLSRIAVSARWIPRERPAGDDADPERDQGGDRTRILAPAQLTEMLAAKIPPMSWVRTSTCYGSLIQRSSGE
jgi:hypothetical protein